MTIHCDSKEIVESLVVSRNKSLFGLIVVTIIQLSTIEMDTLLRKEQISFFPPQNDMHIFFFHFKNSMKFDCTSSDSSLVWQLFTDMILIKN